ncbi:hypothetical protein OROGR_002797 [Orobanche gracilis]
MDEAIALKLLLSVLLMLLYPKTESHWLPHRPHIPLGQVRRPIPIIPTTPLVPRPVPINHTTPLCESQFALANSGCAMIPYAAVSPSSPLSRHHHHRHHHSHGHNHNHNHSHSHQSYAGNTTVTSTEECCRWLKEVDNICVCNVLLRLPAFLFKPAHNYTVMVNSTCEVTFQCGSSLVEV